MKKIAIIHGKMVMGGAERVLVNMLHHFKYDVYDVTLFLEGSIENGQENLEQLVDGRVKIKYWGDKVSSDFGKFVDEEFYDCAISYQGLDILHLCVLNQMIKASRRVAWIHGDCRYVCNSKSKVSDYKLAYSRVDKIVCVSEGVRTIFCEVFPSLEKSTTTIYNLYDEDEILLKSAEDVRIPYNGLSLLSVGRMSEEKGHVLIPLVAKRLRDNGVVFHWYIIGDGECRTKVERLARKYRVDDCVTVLGYIANPYPYIRKCGVFVLPSFSEGFCTVTQEALFLGKLVVATPVCGMSEQIEDGVTGVLSKDVDSESIFQALYSLLLDKELQNRIYSNIAKKNIANVHELQKLYDYIDEKRKHWQENSLPKISVVIPVYNVEKYLVGSLKSVMYQTYRNIEIVCVDDGSTDQSPSILQSMAGLDPRILIIKQENQGLFMARKNGILQSTGDWLVCMDSDDWLDPDSCRIFAEYISKNPDVDLMQYGVTLEGGRFRSRRSFDKWFNGACSEINGNLNMLRTCYSQKLIPWNIASKVIRMSIAKKAYKLQPDIRYSALEDMIACFYLMTLSNRWLRIPNRFYHYRLTSGMTSKNKSFRNDFQHLASTMGYTEAFRYLVQYAESLCMTDRVIEDALFGTMLHQIVEEMSFSYYVCNDRAEDFFKLLEGKLGKGIMEKAFSCKYRQTMHKMLKYKRLFNTMLATTGLLLIILVLVVFSFYIRS